MLKTSSKSCDGMTTMLPAVLLCMCPAHFNVHALRVALGPNKRMCPRRSTSSWILGQNQAEQLKVSEVHHASYLRHQANHALYTSLRHPLQFVLYSAQDTTFAVAPGQWPQMMDQLYYDIMCQQHCIVRFSIL